METQVSKKSESQKVNHTMRDVFELMDQYGHEQVIFCRHRPSDLKAIIAIHDTTLGPATGGCRMFPYQSTDEGLEDVLKLSRGMTFKCGLADVDYGGGKMVILGDDDTKSPELFRAMGRFVEGLGKRFYTGTDMGTNPEDFTHAARESTSILGLPSSFGGSGDTSILTAIGVIHGMKATAVHLWGSSSLKGKVVAVQGIGKVGLRLVALLVEEGAQCIVSDLNHKRLHALQKEYPEKVEVCTGRIFDADCDIFSPCARGGIICEESIPKFRCEAIVGAANNQLLRDEDGDHLHEVGILYAPDYVVNAGGLIQVSDEIEGYSESRATAKTKNIYNTLLQIYNRSKRENIPTCRAADKIVMERLKSIADVRRIFLGCN